MVLSLLLASALYQAPAPVPLEAGSSYFFGSDALTWADYLGLNADGRYVLVGAQHLYTDVEDKGRWHVEDGRILLESEEDLRDIDLDDLRVYVHGRCAVELLPELRAELDKLSHRLRPVTAKELEAVQLRRNDHNRACNVAVVYSPDEYPAPPVEPKRLAPVVRAIDAWLSEADTQDVFEYQAWEYRGQRFLVPMRPGMHAVQSTADEVRRDMDGIDGRRAPYIYYAISAEDFARASNCTYAFRVHTELNRPCSAPTAAGTPDASVEEDDAGDSPSPSTREPE